MTPNPLLRHAMTDTDFDTIQRATSAIVPGVRFGYNGDRETGMLFVMHNGQRYAAPCDGEEAAPFPVTTLAETKPRAIAAAEELRAVLSSLPS